MKRNTCAGFSVILGGLLSFSAFAADIYYVYTDQQGRIVMQDWIPPEYIGGGYRIVNASGVTLKVVAPVAVTNKQNENKARLARLVDEKQMATDRALLQTYANAAEIEEIKAKRIASIEDIIRTTQSHNEAFLRNLAGLIGREASFKEQSLDVPEQLQADIQELQQRIAQNMEYVERKREEQEQQRQKFDQDITRFKHLQRIYQK